MGGGATVRSGPPRAGGSGCYSLIPWWGVCSVHLVRHTHAQLLLHSLTRRWGLARLRRPRTSSYTRPHSNEPSSFSSDAAVYTFISPFDCETLPLLTQLRNYVPDVFPLVSPIRPPLSGMVMLAWLPHPGRLTVSRWPLPLCLLAPTNTLICVPLRVSVHYLLLGLCDPPCGKDSSVSIDLQPCICPGSYYICPHVHLFLASLPSLSNCKSLPTWI